MKLRFIQDISIGIGGELAGWHRVGEILETRDPLTQWVLDNGYAVAVDETESSEEAIGEDAPTEDTTTKTSAKKAKK